MRCNAGGYVGRDRRLVAFIESCANTRYMRDLPIRARIHALMDVVPGGFNASYSITSGDYSLLVSPERNKTFRRGRKRPWPFDRP